MPESACLFWAFVRRNSPFQRFVTSNWHVWQITQMSDKSLSPKTLVWRCIIVNWVKLVPVVRFVEKVKSQMCLDLPPQHRLVSVFWPIFIRGNTWEKKPAFWDQFEQIRLPLLLNILSAHKNVFSQRLGFHFSGCCFLFTNVYLIHHRRLNDDI